MLNYKEHPSKTSHVRPNKNSIGMFFCTFLTNIYSAHKYLLSYHFLYKMQEHENKAMYTLAIYRNNMICYSFVIYRRYCRFTRYDMIFVGMVNFIIFIINSCVIAVTCFSVVVSELIPRVSEYLPLLSWVQWSKDNAFRYRFSCCKK
ncbi:hypothetical protein M9H77_00190 [Catharanthus roseus]|nr:hypothetical protein M9H77_00190 [Catharanthus roseus]